MKRGKPLARKSGLSRRTQLSPGSTSLARGKPLAQRSEARTAREEVARADPRRAAFKEVFRGRCAACGARGLVRRHHVLLEQMVRVAKGDPEDQANSIALGLDFVCSCHAGHHSGGDRRLSYLVLPRSAIAFAVETIGEGPAATYFYRRYLGAPDPLESLRREQECQ